MLQRVLGDLSFQVLYKGLEGTRARAEAIADNLANVSTPGYKRKVVRFEDQLAAALDRNRFRGSCSEDRGRTRADLSSVRPEVTLDMISRLRADGNTVDIDQEAAQQAMNTERFMAMIEILNREYRMLHRAIREEIR